MIGPPSFFHSSNGEGKSFLLPQIFAVLVCCANRRAPTSTRSTGFCFIWACMRPNSSSSPTPRGRAPQKESRPTQRSQLPHRLPASTAPAFPPLYVSIHAPGTQTHSYPQHWLLCHMIKYENRRATAAVLPPSNKHRYARYASSSKRHTLAV